MRKGKQRANYVKVVLFVNMIESDQLANCAVVGHNFVNMIESDQLANHAVGHKFANMVE
jgi:hypothetical protein